MALVNGPGGGDTLFGTPAADLIQGFDVDDLLFGFGGNDTLSGGEAFDRVDGGAGNDTYIMIDRWDLFFESTGEDTAIVQADFVKPAEGVEHWNLTSGVKALPYWIDALVGENALFAQKWLGSTNVFFYSFPIDPPSYLTGSDLNGWASLTLAQRSLVKKALDYVESVVDLHFIETQDIQQPNVLVFSNNRQIGSSAYATYPSDNASGSDVFINSTAANLSPNEWSYAALTLMHEIGHALGLKHPFSSAADSTQVSEPPYLSGKEDDSYWTVMSYTQNSYSYGLRYAPLDIAALHYLYGPSQAEKQYDNNFFLNPAGPSFIWDAGGTDCIDGSGLNDNIVLSLNDGDWSWVGRKSDYITDAGQITINIGSLIENAKTGNGNDWTLGNGFSNQLQLGAGNDFADGGAGNDTIDGGADDDLAFYSKATSSYKLYIGINSSLVTDLIGSEGTDTLINIERLAFADKTIRIETKAHGSYGDLPDTLYQFFVVGFGAAAGVTYMDQMAEAYRYWLPQYKDGTVKQIVEVFTTKTQFTSVYPQALYREDEGRYYRYDHDLSQAGKPLVKGAEVSKAVFDTQMANLAQELISIIVKDSASAGAKAQAVSDVRSALGLGGEWTIGKVVYTIFGNLANKPADDPDWAGTAKQFANQVAVSKYYTDTLSQSTDDITTLRSVMAAVTNNTDVSSTEAIASLIGVALLNGPGG